MKTVARKVTVQAGIFLFSKITGRKKDIQKERAPKSKPSSKDVIAINDKNAERDLSIKLHANFGSGDIHAVLTYSGDEPSMEQAKKNLDKFKRDLSKLYKKHCIDNKWIEVTEYKNKRIHHHFILKKVAMEEIVKIWPHGFVRPTWLDNTGDYRKLVSYLIKETSKTFREPDAFAKRRYHCSRAVKAPDAREEEVSIQQLFEPKANKGYQIDQDSVWKGINPATDRPYIEFIQIALDEPKPYKRGKKRKYQKEKFISYIPEEEQCSLFD